MCGCIDRVIDMVTVAAINVHAWIQMMVNPRYIYIYIYKGRWTEGEKVREEI